MLPENNVILCWHSGAIGQFCVVWNYNETMEKTTQKFLESGLTEVKRHWIIAPYREPSYQVRVP
jgi:hypothetical protein